MLNEYLECGEIVRAHGINGAMVVNHFCDSVEVFEALKLVYLKEGNQYRKMKVVKASPYKNSVLLTLDGIKTPEEVVALRMKKLYAHRNDILKDEGDFFIVDLIGLPIKDAETNQAYGTLKDVVNQGGGDLYVLLKSDGKEAYIPAIPEFLSKISLDEGIFITPIEGLID